MKDQELPHCEGDVISQEEATKALLLVSTARPPWRFRRSWIAAREELRKNGRDRMRKHLAQIRIENPEWFNVDGSLKEL